MKKTFIFALALCLLLSACGSGMKDELEALRAELEEVRSENARMNAEKESENIRISEEKRIEEERLEAERIAEEERLEAERIAEEERIAAENVYEKQITRVSSYMRVQGLLYEIVHYGISRTWRNAIDLRRDFSKAVNDYLSSIEENPDLNDIHSLEEIAELMIDIQNPPDKFKDAYTAVIEMYEIYVQMAEQAKNPSGSLQTYNAKTDELSTKFNSVYSKIQILLPRVEDEEYIIEAL